MIKIKKIRTKFLIPILILQFIALGVLGFIGYRFSSNILKTKAEHEFSQTINSVDEVIDSELSKRIASAQNLLDDPIFIKFLSAKQYKAGVDAEVFNFMKGNGLALGEPNVGDNVNFPIGFLANEGNRKILSDGIFPSEEYVDKNGRVIQHVYLGGSNDVDFEMKDNATLDRSHEKWFQTAIKGNIYVGKPQLQNLFLRQYDPIGITTKDIIIEKELIPIALPHLIGDKIEGVLLVTTTPDFIYNIMPKNDFPYVLLVLDSQREIVAWAGDQKIKESVGIPQKDRSFADDKIESYGTNLLMQKSSKRTGWSVMTFGTKDSIYGSIYALRNNIFIVILLSVLLMGAIVFMIIRKLLAPVISLTRASDKIADGELGIVIQKTSDDEIGKLTDSFNHMSLATRTMHERISRMNFIRRQLLRIISHELKTPLNAVINFFELAQDEIESSNVAKKEPELVNMMDHLGKGIERCEKLVERLTKTSQVMAGEITSGDDGTEHCEAAATISGMLEKIRPSAAERNVKLRFNPAPECLVACPENALRLLIEESVSNAIKYSPDNETVEINLSASSEKIKIEVIDKGPGISKDYTDDVVEPFFEIQDADKHFSDRYKRGAGGLGLGLTIILSILKRYQGNMEIASQEGHGTNLIMTLPLANDIPPEI